jgi:hypothetical protein
VDTSLPPSYGRRDMINGDSFEVTAYGAWVTASLEFYNGKIGPQGRIPGSTYDKQPSSNHGGFFIAMHRRGCASLAAVVAIGT